MPPAGSWFHIVDVNTDGVVSANPATVHGVVIGTEVAAQTLKLHDCATEAAAAAGNLVTTLKLDTRGSVPICVRFTKGVVAILSGGTPDLTIVWG